MSTETEWVSWFEAANIPKEASEKYSKAFVAHSITLNHLPLLDHSLLTEMGISSVGHRLDILYHAKGFCIYTFHSQKPAQPSLIQKINAAVSYLSSRVPGSPPTHGIILGSGLGDIVDHMENQVVVPYEEIPFFQRTTAHSHTGALIIGAHSFLYQLKKTGDFGGSRVAAMKGRHHYYEGYSVADTCFPIQVLKGLFYP